MSALSFIGISLLGWAAGLAWEAKKPQLSTLLACYALLNIAIEIIAAIKAVHP